MRASIPFLVASLVSLPAASPTFGQTGDPASHPRSDPDLPGVSFRFVETNGIRMHVAEAGEGPLVILVHGFPESWYSWRHQLPALAGAGYRVVAPDMRGYGRTDRPPDVDRYNLLDSSAAAVASLLRPDLFPATVLLSVPYLPRRDAERPPMEGAAGAAATDGTVLYMVYFQDPEATAELEKDVRRSLLTLLYSASGSAPPEERWRPLFRREEGFFSSVTMPADLPDWLKEEDLDVYARQFARSGFDAPLNWYRAIDHGWRLRGFLTGARLTQPTLFIGGEVGPGLTLFRQDYDDLEENAPNLTKKVLLPGKGHWIQQEAPEEVNRLILEFLSAVGESPVPVHREPRHALVLDSVRFRVMDVRIQPGDTTLFHVHDSPALYVAIAVSPIDVQAAGGSWSGTSPTADPGWASGDVLVDSAYASTPVTHRVANVGSRPFRLLMVTSCGPRPSRGEEEVSGEIPGSQETVSTWFRQSRVRLEPGAGTGWHVSRSPVLIVSPFDGAFRVELGSGETAALGSPGSWFLIPSGTRYRLSNRGDSAAEAVAVQIR